MATQFSQECLCMANYENAMNEMFCLGSSQSSVPMMESKEEYSFKQKKEEESKAPLTMDSDICHLTKEISPFLFVGFSFP